MSMSVLQRIKTAPQNLFWLLLALIPILSGLVYYFYALNSIGIVISLILVILCLFFVFKYKPLQTKNHEKKLLEQVISKKTGQWSKIIGIILILGYGAAIFFSFKELQQQAFSKAVISPWQIIGHRFFFSYGAAALFLILSLLKSGLNNFFKLVLISGFYFLSFSVSAIAYKIGYGYDPFIHQATMEFIAAKGFILPKTPYYLGEYGLIIILNRLSGISLHFLNTFLVPALAAICLPVTFYNFLKNDNAKPGRRSALLATLCIIIIGGAPFILTTPQNLSYLFLILTIFWGLKEKSLLLGTLLAFATLIIHPLTGLPALGFLLFLWWQKLAPKISLTRRKIFFYLVLAFNVLSLPLALFVGGGGKLQIAGLSAAGASLLTIFSNFQSAGSENIFLNAVYFIDYNRGLFLLILVLASLIIFNKKNREEKTISGRAIKLSIISLIGAYVLSSLVSFKEVIDYEQGGYTKRILIIILIFCLPFILQLLEKIIRKIRGENNFIKIAWLIFGLSLVLISLYSSYPRLDKYYNSRGYSTSLNDLKAVETIETQTPEPYLVLANQQVSAAALKKFGFNHYLNTSQGQLYFYPIPTGGLLYQYYLKAVYEAPSRENMLAAMDLGNTNEAYLVINEYWNQSARLIDAAKLTADSWQDIDEDIYIFRYQR
jgi:hypothetical protein